MLELSAEQKKMLAIAQNKCTKMRQLQTKCRAFAEVVGKQTNICEQLNTDLTKLEKEIDELQKLLSDEIREQSGWKNTFDSVNAEYSKLTDCLEQLFYLLGYRLSLQTLETNIQLATFHYNEHCFVSFLIGEHYELQQIYPKHPNFEGIKAMLLATNDAAGLLTNMQTFFDAVMQLTDRRKKSIDRNQQFS